MAAVSFLLQPPPLFLLPSRKLFLTPQPKPSSNRLFRAYPSPKRFTIRASASRTPRIRKKVKSNAELCSEIREFLACVGLPEDHVPSTKELLHHGRNELAYIVRRRGHKLLRELLPNSRKSDIIELNAEKSLGTAQEATVGCEDSLTGQDEKVNRTVEVVSFSTAVSLGDSSPNIDLYLHSSDSVGISTETPGKSLEEDDGNEKVNNRVGGDSLSMEMSVIDDYSGSLTNNPYLNSIDRDGMSIKLPTSPLEEDSSNNLNGHEDAVNNVVDDNSLSTKGSPTESYPGSLNIVGSDLIKDSDSKPQQISVSSSFDENDNLKIKDEKASGIGQDVSVVDCSPSSEIESTFNSDGMPTESSSNLSLKKKIAKFIQNGELDLVEDESGVQESKGLKAWDEAIGVKPRTVAEENAEYVLAEDKSDVTLNGSVSTSKSVHPPLTANYHLWDDQNPSERLVSADSGNNLDETVNNEDQAEINHLKLMLHQKELELTRLKEQIEKEKLALSVLQSKVETEINKAQEIIHEKDVELHAVEENLSGLEEVEIQYSGDGEIVEVAGSFNGWHHKIKLDPLPASDSSDPAGPRKPKLWSTVLWLYPGTYEIKFIVDGQWRIDPQRESVTKGTICNNILQVDA